MYIEDGRFNGRAGPPAEKETNSPGIRFGRVAGEARMQ